MQRQDTSTRWLAGHQMAIAALLILAPILAVKVVPTWGFRWTASLIAVTFIYAFIDVINEIWGPREARFTIIVGSVIRVVLFLTLVPIVLALPTALVPEGFNEVVELTARVFLAGEIAVLLGNLLFDIPIFARLKNKEIGGFFVRTNVSNLVSNTLSAAMFSLIAFAGTPLASWRLFFGQIVFRYIFAFAVSPFTTLWVRWMRGRIGSR